jgi:pimeloyl-ACP methyl ester carboxylesterase
MDRLTPAEKEAFAEAKTRAGAGDPTAAAELAQFFWRTDFSDPANAPDFRVKPLFDYPRNDEVGNVLTASANESLSGGGLADAVGQISVPVLILHGREDPLPVEGAIDLASRLPAAELVVLDNVGHDVWLEDAAATEEALRRFLERAIA